MMSSSHGPGGSPTSGQANSPTTSVPQGIKANAFTAATVSVNSKYDHLKSKGFQADVIYPLPVYHEYCHGPSTSFADVHRPLLNQKTSDSFASLVGATLLQVGIGECSNGSAPPLLYAYPIPIGTPYKLASIVMRYIESRHLAVDLKHELETEFPNLHEPIYVTLTTYLTAIVRFLNLHSNTQQTAKLKTAYSPRPANAPANSRTGVQSFARALVEGIPYNTFVLTCMYLGHALNEALQLKSHSGASEDGFKVYRSLYFHSQLRNAYLMVSSLLDLSSYETELARKFQADQLAKHGIPSNEVDSTAIIKYAQHLHFIDFFSKYESRTAPPSDTFSTTPECFLTTAKANTVHPVEKLAGKIRERDDTTSSSPIVAASTPKKDKKKKSTASKGKPASPGKPATPSASHPVNFFPGNTQAEYNELVKSLQLPKKSFRGFLFELLKTEKLLPGQTHDKKVDVAAITAAYEKAKSDW